MTRNENLSEKDFVRTERPCRVGCIAALLCLVVSWGAPAAKAFTSTDADTIFEAHTKAFYKEKNGCAWFKESTTGEKKASFWTRAEQLEMVLDAYERTRKAQQLGMFTNLFHGFLADHQTNWNRNPYNDDSLRRMIRDIRGDAAAPL